MSAINIYDILRKQHRGRLLESLEQDLAECLKAVRESGKEGEVTLKITITPIDRQVQQVNIGTSHSAKIPRQKRAPTMMFVTPDGGLSDRDPRQASLPGEMHVVAEDRNIDGRSAAAGER